MFNDKKQALQRLNEQLLAMEEEPEEAEEMEETASFYDFESDEEGQYDDCDEAPALPPAMGRRASGRIYNTDRTDTDLDPYSREVREGRKENLSGLLVTALCLLAGIFAVLAWLVFRFT